MDLSIDTSKIFQGNCLKRIFIDSDFDFNIRQDKNNKKERKKSLTKNRRNYL